MKKLNLFVAALFIALTSFLGACSVEPSGPHNLSPDEARRAQVNAEAYFNQEHPAGTNAAGELVKKKGSYISCRPQDSNSNNLVTCTGMKPTMQGGFTQATMYCGYNAGANAIIGCNDKDQK